MLEILRKNIIVLVIHCFFFDILHRDNIILNFLPFSRLVNILNVIYIGFLFIINFKKMSQES